MWNKRGQYICKVVTHYRFNRHKDFHHHHPDADSPPREHPHHPHRDPNLISIGKVIVQREAVRPAPSVANTIALFPTDQMFSCGIGTPLRWTKHNTGKKGILRLLLNYIAIATAKLYI